MSRNFVRASNERVALGLGGLTFGFGPGTIAAVFRMSALPGAAVYPCILGCGSTLAIGYTLYVSGDNNRVQLNLNSQGADSQGAVIAANKWYLAVATKTTGTVLVRFHLYDYLVGTYAHQDSQLGVSKADSSAPVSNLTLGGAAGGNASYAWNGDIAAAAVWNVVLTDSQAESLALDVSVANWNGITKARALWIPDPNPAVTVVDLSGGGANETSHTGSTATKDDFPLFNPSRMR